MRKLESLIAIVEEFLRRLSSFNWLAALLMRLFVGYFFFETGWAKLHNLDAFTQRFMEWDIPHPAFNAALSAYTECIGGALTVVGLGMRFVSIPMMINMAVAIITVKLKNVAGLDDFVELDEPLYALVYFWLMISGAGWISIDNLIRQTLGAALRNDKSPGLSSATSSASVSPLR
ncbi:MAG TPA: DoxX family protein [Candidatus Binataceae bacterium]